MGVCLLVVVATGAELVAGSTDKGGNWEWTGMGTREGPGRAGRSLELALENYAAMASLLRELQGCSLGEIEVR